MVDIRLVGDPQQFPRLVEVLQGRNVPANFREAMLKRLAHQIDCGTNGGVINLDSMILWEDCTQEEPS